MKKVKSPARTRSSSGATSTSSIGREWRRSIPKDSRTSSSSTWCWRPKGGKLFRMINIGGKRLPDVGEQERNWGYVEAITQSGYHLEEGLRREERAAPRSSRSFPLRGHAIRANLS